MLAVAKILTIVLVGYALKRVGLFGAGEHKVLQKVVLNITLPAAIVSSFATGRHDLGLLWISVFAFACATIPLVTMFVVSRRMPVAQRAFLMLNGAGFNVGNFTLPILTTFIGPAAALPAIMFDVGNSIMMSAGNYVTTAALLHIDSSRPLASQIGPDPSVTVVPHDAPPTDRDARRLARRAFARTIARNFLTSVPFDVYMVMTILMVAGVKPPMPVADFLSPIADGNTVVSMLMIGMMMDLPGSRRDVTDALLIVACRFAFGLLFAFAAWHLLPFDAMTRKAVVFICFAPAGIFSAIFTDKVLGNARLSGFCLTVMGFGGVAAMAVANALL
ncbi:AEC family transporter [Bifidobacterium sp. MA2]|uniref:AEC family transporter n=1 Tax=Bifidobacterium santillanense TaxID=2809028 RepID=A0ABS5USH8_9BIFI|nr:AEC family transporter [Bifidobacterium santillanense]MBT1173761.1 AEC family transporter [Bifidobacterium santillanense]